MGPPVDSVQLPYKWLNSMVYGRYNELVHGDTIMVYKPTNITEGPHPVPSGNLSVCYWKWPFIVR